MVPSAQANVLSVNPATSFIPCPLCSENKKTKLACSNLVGCLLEIRASVGEVCIDTRKI